MSNTIGMYGGKFLPPHMGHIYAATKASTVVDKLYIVVCYNDKLDREYCENSKDLKYLSGDTRVRMLSQIFKDLPHVKVIGVEDNAESSDLYDWQLGAKNIKQIIHHNITDVFGSEPEYSVHFSNNYPDATYSIIDANRETYPISATRIRTEGIFNNWEFIPKNIRSYFIKKIVLVGTESCGKSTMVRNLARLYNTTCTYEYGREVSEMIGGDPVLIEDDFLKIAEHQRHVEETSVNTANKITFIDTETITTQYYSQLYIGKTIPLLEAIIDRQRYDLWLYLEPDVPWVDDDTRLMGDDDTRHRNNILLKHMLGERNIKYHSIIGDYSQKLQTILELVNPLINNKGYNDTT